MPEDETPRPPPPSLSIEARVFSGCFIGIHPIEIAVENPNPALDLE